MKLVEILARELEEWPSGSGFATQDPDREVRFEEMSADFYASELAEDSGRYFGAGVEVTREMWEAERERLGLEQTVPEWDGYGLPPIGAQVMFEDNQCEVIAYHNGMVVCAMEDDYESGCYDGFSHIHLRPIKSDREKWIKAAKKASKNYYGEFTLGKIYDAGLAKLPG